MIAPEIIEQIKDAADLVTLIGEHVELKRTGSDFRAPCPFHGGTHRNFAVIPRKGMFYCFEDESLDKAARLMQQRAVHHLTVLNRQKRMVGLVSLSDLALNGEPATRAEVIQLAARDAAKHKAA